MRFDLIEYGACVLASLFMVLFAFFLPVSPSLKSIFLICSLVFILFTPYFNRHLWPAVNSLWGWSSFGLFAFILLACLWSEAPYATKSMVVEKYLKLIYLPILPLGFINPKLRILCLNSYLAAILLTCVISFLKSKGIFFTGDPGEVFNNHIITGFMVAFGSYLSGVLAFQFNGWRRGVYIMLGLFTTYQVLFINTGRTGYVIYAVLMILLLLQQLSFKKAILGVLLFSGLMGIVYYESMTMQSGVNSLLNDIKSMQANNGNTSLGYRVQFHTYARSLFLTHPLVGIGTGGFKYQFSLDNPVPSWGTELTDPHSQYWMMLSEQGGIGLILLLTFLGSLFISSFQQTETRPILLGILAAFSIGCISDTLLCYSTAGFVLMLMSAVSFGELLEKKAVKKTKDGLPSSWRKHDSLTTVQV